MMSRRRHDPPRDRARSAQRADFVKRTNRSIRQREFINFDYRQKVPRCASAAAANVSVRSGAIKATICPHTSRHVTSLRMNEPAAPDLAHNKLLLRFLTFLLSAEGAVAFWLVVPVSLVLIALAWRI